MLLLAMTAGGLTSACRAPQEIDATPSTPTIPAPSAPPERYTGLKSTCPILTSDAAKKFGASGEGRLSDVPTPSDPSVTSISCSWGHPKHPSVSTIIQIFRNGFPPRRTAQGNAQASFDDAQHGKLNDRKKNKLKRTYEAILDLETEWDAAYLFVSAERYRTEQVTLIDNVMISVTIFVEERYTEHPAFVLKDFLREHPDPLRIITSEIIDNLR